MWISNIQNYFWAEAISTTCYILNSVSIIKVLNKNPYELWKRGKPSVPYFHIFCCTYYILNNKDNLGKFDAKLDKTIFLGYSLSSKAYKIYNLGTQVVEESMNVVSNEHDSTLEKRRIIYLEEELETTRVNQHAQNTILISESPKKTEEEPFETPQKGKV